MQNLDYQRLSFLGDKMKIGKASKAEKDEFMSILFKSGRIDASQYTAYTENRHNAEEVLNAALAIGAILLIGYLLTELGKSK